MRLGLALSLLLVLLGGCGMYGPLYLEEEPAKPEVTEVPPIAGDEVAEEPAVDTEAPREEEDQDDAEPENRRPEGEVGAAGRS